MINQALPNIFGVPGGVVENLIDLPAVEKNVPAGVTGQGIEVLDERCWVGGFGAVHDFFAGVGESVDIRHAVRPFHLGIFGQYVGTDLDPADEGTQPEFSVDFGHVAHGDAATFGDGLEIVLAVVENPVEDGGCVFRGDCSNKGVRQYHIPDFSIHERKHFDGDDHFCALGLCGLVITCDSSGSSVSV